MITRIVKLHFQDEKVETFLAFFETIKHQVNNFPGCIAMKLLQDIQNPCIIMTYRHWEDEQDLENYRTSETFGQIWPKIKPWFDAKPEAWTVKEYFDGFQLKEKIKS